MSDLDISFLLRDPDFVSKDIPLIKRTSMVDDYGRNQLIETQSKIDAVVQPATPEILDKLPYGATLSDSIFVYYSGRLSAEEESSGYCDVIVWQGKRWLVKSIPEDYMHIGNGWTKALCIKEKLNNG